MSTLVPGLQQGAGAGGRRKQTPIFTKVGNHFFMTVLVRTCTVF